MPGATKRTLSQPIEIRPMVEADLAAADRIMRVAFGTFVGLSDPASFMGDASYVATRWRSSPQSAFTAVVDGKVVGSNFATRWGSVGFFGPLTVTPELWDAGIGRCLMEPVLRLFETWRVTHAGLFTFSHSPKHVGIYQTLGFWPRYLTALMAREVWKPAANTPPVALGDLAAAHREARLQACRHIADAQYPGLDLTSEIEAVAAQALGDTVLVEDAGETVGFAVCHVGAGTEAGSRSCYVKFGAVHPGADAARRFERLLDGCAAHAESRGAKTLLAGMNLARHEAYRIMLAREFRIGLLGVTMHRPNEPGHSRPERFVIDDWR